MGFFGIFSVAILLNLATEKIPKSFFLKNNKKIS